jgi:hypothetical protein
VQNTLEGYIIEFATENHQTFLKEEAVFRDIARGRMLQEIPFWINILLVEEGMFPVP